MQKIFVFYAKCCTIEEKIVLKNVKRLRANLLTDVQGVLRLWWQHFSKLLRGNGDINFTTREDSKPPPIDNDDEVELSAPSHNEVRVAIQRLKNNRAAGPNGLPAELFKAEGDELISSMHQLICRIWLEESMPSDWNLSDLCPFPKKRDPTICANYRGISLLPIVHKVLTSVL